MSLPAEGFIRRFLLHVLPKGFMRIRHFGLLANRHRAEHLAPAGHWMGPRLRRAAESVEVFLARVMGFDLHRCPKDACDSSALTPNTQSHRATAAMGRLILARLAMAEPPGIGHGLARACSGSRASRAV